MNNAILKELVKTWKAEATPIVPGPTKEKDKNFDARLQGRRESRIECADTLENMINIFKD